MSKELSEKGLKEWEESLKVDSVLSDGEIVLEVKNFLKSYDVANEEDKKKLLEGLIKSFANKMGVTYKTIKLLTHSRETILGSYDRFSKTIKIVMNSGEGSFHFSPNVVTTVIHELRHAYQDQHLYNRESELGEVVKYHTNNYISSDNDKIINQIGYNTNFLEVDAQRFSFAVGKALAEEILKTADKESLFARRILNVKLNRIKAEANNYEKSFEEYTQKKANFKTIFKHLKNHLISSSQTFYNAKFDSKDDEILQASLHAKTLSEILYSKEMQEVMDISVQDIAHIYMEILTNVKPENLAGKLDNKLTDNLLSASYMLRGKVSLHVNKDGKLLIYDDYIQKIKESIDFGKIFFDKFSIKYNKNDSKEIYLNYSDNAFEYLSKLFMENKISDFDKMLMDNVSSMETRDPVHFGREKFAEKLVKKYSEKDLKKILRANVDTDLDNELISKFGLNRCLFDGYGECYVSEKHSGVLSEFLNYGDVKFDKNNFDDVFEKFNLYYPKFYASCMKKNDLSENDETYILNPFILSGNQDRLISKLVKEIKSNYSYNEIKALFENSNDNFAVELLKQRGVTLDNFKETPSKVSEQSGIEM